MPSKEEVLNSIQPTQQYLGSFVREKIESITTTFVKRRPSVVKVGDVYRAFQGVKVRPLVVVKILKDVIISVPLTSTENIHNSGIPYKCRFFGEGFFCKTYDLTSKELVIENFVGVLEDKKAIRQIKNEIKEFTSRF